ncbi:MAG TPA: hypothetical protein VME70_05190 [Mycobacteriales bacterium]|nr:hypothetical protein [Mycobacteriales bacterium]
MSDRATADPGHVVSMTYARTHMHELIRAIESGETVALSRRGKVVAFLRPPTAVRKLAP